MKQYKTKAKQRASNKKWRASNKDKCKEQKLKKRYGLTLTAHDKMYKNQKGLCGMCHKHLEYDGACVDHCHTTGKIRSLVHDFCNRLEGIMNQCTDEHIASIMAYTKKHKSLI